MSQDIHRLEELLARVQRNAAQPRPARAAAPVVQKLDAQPAASAWSPPSAALPEPVFLPPAPVVAPVFSPPPPSHAPPSQTLDDAVDDLLADPFPASSAPPPPLPPIIGEVLEDPMPYVPPSAAAPVEHISGVMPVAELSEQPPEELLEDDIVEMSSAEAAEAGLPAQPSAPSDDLNFDDEDEQPAAQREAFEDEEPPASSSRRVPTSMDEALARAAEQMEIQEGREVPLKTPPPESGPQRAMAPMPSPAAPNIDELLEADILPARGMSPAVPTTEQLGQTIDLEEGRGPRLELDHPPPAQVMPEPIDELEITLPGGKFVGGYQADLMPPPEARQDLDAHRNRVGDEDEIPPPPESLAQYPSARPPASADGMFAAPSVTTESSAGAVSTVTIEASPNAEFSHELLARPELSPSPIAKFIRADAPRPSTFLELLDASLALGRD